jgi:single-strand DNA-binding protein
MSVNKVILVGNLGADPELRYLPNGTAVCSMKVATNRRYTDKNRQVQEEVQWHRVTAWAKLAELCKSYLTKGRRVYVEGRIKNGSYEDKTTGQKRYTSEVVSEAVVFLDGGRRTAEAPGSRACEPGDLSSSLEETPPGEAQVEDEVPF